MIPDVEAADVDLIGKPARTIHRPNAAWIAQRIETFDNDPRVVLLGAAIGLVYAVLMAGSLDRQHPGIAGLLIPVALAAPTAGVSVIAALAVFREPSGLAPLNFNATIIGACALGVLLRLAVRSISRPSVRVRPEYLAIGAYLGLTTFQFLWVALRVNREQATFARYELTEVLSGLILIIVISVLFTPRTRPYLLAVMVPGIVLAAAIAVVSLSPHLLAALPIQGWLPSVDISARATGFFRNPNYMGQAMAMALILVGRGRTMGLPGPLTRWSPLIATLVAFAVIASFSRGALIAATAGVVVLYVGRRRRVLAAVAAVAALVIFAGYQVLLAARHLITFGSDIAASGAAQDASDAARLAVYKAGLEMFVHKPLFGFGYGQFHYESVKYLGPAAVTYSHDVYLGIAVEQGILGILLFAAVLAAVGYALWRARDPFAVTAAAMLVAFLAGSLFAEDLTSLQTSVVLWVALGSALVISGSREAPPAGRGNVRSPGSAPIRGGPAARPVV